MSLGVVGITVWFTPTPVEAHAAIKGASEIINGFLHPFITPLHLLVLLSLGLVLSRRLPLQLGWPLAGFATFSAVGLLLTVVSSFGGTPPPILIGIGLCAGGLVALALRLPLWVQLTACAAAGLALGLDSGVDPGATGTATAKTLCATWLSLSFCAGNVAFYTSRLPSQQWVQTGVRVIGSWIVAIALLLLAFSLRR